MAGILDSLRQLGSDTMSVLSMDGGSIPSLLGNLQQMGAQQQAAHDQARATAAQYPRFSPEWIHAMTSDPWLQAFGVGSIQNVGAPLDMSLAARMGRAADQGYTVDAYHGTRADVPTFAPDTRKANSAVSFFTSDPDVGSAYSVRYGGARPAGIDDAYDALRARLQSEGVNQWDVHRHPEWKALDEQARVMGANVLPVKLRMQNPYTFEDTAEGMRVKDDPQAVQAIFDRGHDGIVIPGVLDRPIAYTAADLALHRPSNIYLVPDPSQVRSRFAAFDPAKIGSSDILAGLGGAGLLGALYSGSDQ
jgi:hypothetical protein